MDFLAKILAGVTLNAAENGSSKCFGWVWEEPTCPEEIL